jgi:hypothetical protein
MLVAIGQMTRYLIRLRVQTHLLLRQRGTVRVLKQDFSQQR